MEVIFFGTPQLACSTLESLIESAEVNVRAVVTMKDKPVGRKGLLTATPVKKVALEHGIEVLTPDDSAELYALLKNYEVDFFVVFAFGMIFRKEVLDLPRVACVNVHTSLLPKYRGASPIHQAILNGDERAGISIMKMDEGMDSGPVYGREELVVGRDSLLELNVRMGCLSAEVIVRYLQGIYDDDLKAEGQDESAASYCKKIRKEDGLLDFSLEAAVLVNRVRALNPWPGTYCFLNGVRTVLLKVCEVEKELQIGRVLIEGKRVFIGCGKGAVEILKLKPAGKKEMDIVAYLNGASLPLTLRA